jgi:hypothetical protein
MQPMLKLEIWAKIVNMYKSMTAEQKKELYLPVTSITCGVGFSRISADYEKEFNLRSGNLLLVRYTPESCCFGYVLGINYQQETKKSIIYIQVGQQDGLKQDKVSMLKILNIGYMRNEMKALVALESLKSTGIVEKVLNPELIYAPVSTDHTVTSIDNLDQDQKNVINVITRDCIKSMHTPNIMAIEVRTEFKNQAAQVLEDKWNHRNATLT